MPVYVIARLWGTTFSPQSVAYPPNDQYLKHPRIRGVALPFAFPSMKDAKTGKRIYTNRDVRVFMRLGAFQAEAIVMDSGPWCVDDPFWRLNQRPRAEAMHAAYKSGDRGPAAKDFKNRYVTQPGSIDLSPQVWVDLGVSEKVAYGLNHSQWIDAVAIVEPER